MNFASTTELIAHYKSVRMRLRHPPNAKIDHGIDLRRRRQPPTSSAPSPPTPQLRHETTESRPLPIDETIAILMTYWDATECAPLQAPSQAEPIIVDDPIILHCRDIIRVVAWYYGVPAINIVGRQRGRKIVRPRHVAMYLCRELTPASLPQIGRRLGNRDHTTVMHGVGRIATLLATDTRLRSDVAIIKQHLGVS